MNFKEFLQIRNADEICDDILWLQNVVWYKF